MPSLWCMCCNRGLKVAESVQRGLGPICYGRQQAAIESNETSDKVDIPFNPETMDIVVERRADGLHFNIFQVFKHHSPTGFEIGYGGSGPADFALNVMVLFTNHFNEPRDVQLWDKHKISHLAWSLHQEFKRDFVATLPRDGGTIKGDDIRKWIHDRLSTGSFALAA